MALQELPVLDALMSGVPYWKETQNDFSPIGGRFRETLKGCCRVMAPEGLAADWMNRDKFPTAEEVGPQLLPFDSLWIESKRFGYATEDGSYFPDGVVNVGSIVRKSGELTFSIQTFEMVGSSIHQRRNAFYIETDKYGRIAASGPVPVVQSSHEKPEDIPENQFAPELAASLNALMTIGFMNCRNVSITRHERPVTKSKKQRRQRPPKLDYHTITLPGERSGSSSSGEVRDIMPRHKVRGHFKTYTAEAPLMGKHIGTYWWGWQVRGNKKNGITVTDYKVGA